MTIKRRSTETCIPLKPLLKCSFSVSVAETIKKHLPEELIVRKVSGLQLASILKTKLYHTRSLKAVAFIFMDVSLVPKSTAINHLLIDFSGLKPTFI